MIWLGRLALALGMLLVLVLLALAGLLAEAHLEIHSLERALPGIDELVDFAESEAEGPVRLRYFGSGHQRRADGTMSTYGGFLLEWGDGRSFAVDVGMTRPGMREFGAALGWATAAGPIDPHGSMGERLGRAAGRLVGVGFSHLHHDHTDGMQALCLAREGWGLSVYQTRDQAERGNYTTLPGRARLAAAACVRRLRFEAPDALDVPDGDRLQRVPGLPGLAVFPVAGHTPGSTVFVAAIDGRLWVLAGDVTNVYANLLENRSKGFVYSSFITPESPTQLERLRRELAAWAGRPDVELLVAHDLDRIEAAGIDIAPPHAGGRRD